MKKVLVLALLTLVVLGCSNNEIEIKNSAAASITFHFRGETFDVPSGGSTTIEKIPDGTFSYSTVYSVPAGLKGSATGGSGSFIFEKHDTRYTAEYASTQDTATYKISFTYTSNLSSKK